MFTKEVHVGLFEGPAFIQTIRQFKNFQKALIGWKKSGLSKKGTLFLGPVNRLTLN